MTTHTIKFEGLTLEVTGTYYAGYLGDLENPPEPREFEIESVFCEHIDLTELLENSFCFVEVKNMDKNWMINRSKLDDIEELILNEHY